MEHTNNSAQSQKYFNFVKDHSGSFVDYGSNIYDAVNNSSNDFSVELNSISSKNIELSKEFLACKTLDNLIDWGEKAIDSNFENYLNISSLLFKTSFSSLMKINAATLKKISKNYQDLK